MNVVVEFWLGKLYVYVGIVCFLIYCVWFFLDVNLGFLKYVLCNCMFLVCE